jgi:predicted RNA-binding protein with PUA-like domain
MPTPTHRYWLLKTEPETYSFERLLREGKTHWNGVRNFQARNFLKAMQPGDLAIIYHSGKERAAVGLSQISRGPYPDLSGQETRPGDWVQVDLQPVEAFSQPVSLAELKADPALKDLLLIRQSRLSVMPLTETEFQRITLLGKANFSPSSKKERR